MLSERMNVPYIAASFFGGTSLLIIVGVILDTMRQIETHLIQRHYDGFLRKGRIRGRFDRSPTGKGQAVQQAGDALDVRRHRAASHRRHGDFYRRAFSSVNAKPRFLDCCRLRAAVG
jgi:hypothetical protein